MSRWAVRHPVVALASWAVLLVAIGVGASAFAGSFNDSFALPGASSTKAQELLTELAPKGKESSSIKVVWFRSGESAVSEKTRREIEPMLKRLAEQPSTTCVTTPFGTTLGRDCRPAAPTDLRAVVRSAAFVMIEKETGLDAAQVETGVQLLDALEPLEKADPAALAGVAKALPALAKLARAPASVVDGLASMTPKDLSGLVGVAGITTADVEALTDAFAAAQRLAGLPPEDLQKLADADPTTLADFARALPSDLVKAQEVMTKVTDEVHRLEDAAGATERATSAVAKDSSVAYATVTFDRTALSASQADRVLSVITDARTPDLQIGISGTATAAAGGGPDSSQGAGLLIAFVILAVAFGSLIAAGLPIVAAITGLVAGQLLVVVVARFTDVPSFAPALAAMIGLGVGIDYSLFILNRFTQGVRNGVEPKDAAVTAVGTAGKAVAFAGSTVIVALLGMFVLRIDFFNGLALAAATTVLMVMLSALWMLPALLSLLGRRSLSLRLPWARHPQPFDPRTSRWSAYGRLLQRMPVVPAVLALVLVGVLAWPAASMTLGFPDDSSAAQGSPARVGFDLLAKGFGDGVNGPFYVAVRTDKPHDYAALRAVVSDLERTPGVASTLPSTGMMPLLELDHKAFGGHDDRITSVIVQPESTPSSERTTELLDRIRADTAPRIAKDTRAQIYVGGTQAVSEDFTSELQAALPVFLLLVVGLGFLALMLLFHSLLIPLTAAVTSLLSFFAALGVTVSVFQKGMADSLLGVTGTGPILPFLPIMVFAILFGLSMDYQVFLVSRMREEWESNPDNKESVRLGLAGSGRVVVVAATIMTSVFLSFVPTTNATIKLFGLALSSAVLIDAFVVRLVLVPSVMSLFGRANWWMPRWLDRVLPRIRLE